MEEKCRYELGVAVEIQEAHGLNAVFACRFELVCGVGVATLARDLRAKCAYARFFLPSIFTSFSLLLVSSNELLTIPCTPFYK